MNASRLILSPIILALAGSALAKPPPVAARLEAPGVALAEAAALIELARSAMRRYLTDRTPADSQSIPEHVRAMAKSSYAVTLTLRSKGAVVARSGQDQRNLPRNVIAAALAAMRSPRLPDRVTRRVLDSLTIELEILGPDKPVTEAALAGVIRPGLTGVRFARGIDDSPLLPSTCYLLDLTGEQIPRHCLGGLRATSGNLAMPVRRTVFATKHYVGFPDGKTVWLYRGKILFPFEAIDRKMLSAAAGRVGDFLARHQTRTGRYTSPDAPGSTGDHLYAAFAMVGLAGRARRKDLTASVRSAVQYGLSRVGRDGDRYWIMSAKPEDGLVATAWMLRIINKIPRNEKTSALREGLLAAIRHELSDEDKLLKRAGSKGGQVWVRGVCAAVMALTEVATTGSKDAALIEKARKALGRLTAPGPAAATWMVRAQVPGRRLPAQAARTPLDERGGFGPIGAPADTALTAWRAVCLAAAEGDKDRGELDAARKFCYRMMYHSPYEAYFAKDPKSYLGGVRAASSGARVTLGACAAAIEAFLVE